METLRIIIIDEEEEASWIADEIKFAGIDFEWQCVENEASFLKALNLHTDIIISEYLLSSFNGLKAKKILQKSKLDIPLIIVTSHGNEEIAVECIKSGISDYIPKKNIKRLPASIQQTVKENKIKKETEDTLFALQMARSAIEFAGMSVFWLNMDGKFLWGNNTGLAALGYRLSQLKEKKISEIDDSLDSIQWQNILKKLCAQKYVAFESRFKTLHDHFIQVELTMTCAHDKRSVFLFALDISEYKKTKVELDRLYTAIEHATDSIFITEKNGNIVYVNPAFEKISGYNRDEVLGKNPKIMKSGKHDEAFYANLWSTLLRGKSWSGHFYNRHKSGAIFEEETRISPIKDKNDKIINFVAVSRDVTNEVTMQKQLHLSQKLEAIGRLAGGVAHDFNNILTIINGYSDLLMNITDKSDATRTHIEQIMKASQKAAELTKQLLAFSKRQPLEPQVVDVNAIISDMMNMLKRLLGEDINLTAQTGGFSSIKADPGQIEQIILNLVVNSRDAMPDGGMLEIKTSTVYLDQAYCLDHYPLKPGRYMHLSVSDNGTGMSDEELAIIFEPFFTTKTTGHGLGLATVFGIVKQNNGHIECKSELNEGTTFDLYFPLVEKIPSAGQKLIDLKDFPRGTETILIVEDEDEVRDLAAKMLKNQGYTIVEAKHGVDALTICKQNEHRFDLLLTDVVMPHMHGPELAVRLKKIFPEIKILFMSGYTDELITPSQRGDNLFFLRKPFNLEQIAFKIRNVLDFNKS